MIPNHVLIFVFTPPSHLIVRIGLFLIFRGTAQEEMSDSWISEGIGIESSMIL
jgi:hypothetical protein